MVETATVPVNRWSCHKGHFISEAAVESEDYRDPGAYYGVSSRIWATCKVCGVIDNPQLVQIGTQEISIDPILERPWETTLSDDAEPGDLG